MFPQILAYAPDVSLDEVLGFLDMLKQRKIGLVDRLEKEFESKRPSGCRIFSQFPLEVVAFATVVRMVAEKQHRMLNLDSLVHELGFCEYCRGKRDEWYLTNYPGLSFTELCQEAAGINPVYWDVVAGWVQSPPCYREVVQLIKSLHYWGERSGELVDRLCRGKGKALRSLAIDQLSTTFFFVYVLRERAAKKGLSFEGTLRALIFNDSSYMAQYSLEYLEQMADEMCMSLDDYVHICDQPTGGSAGCILDRFGTNVTRVLKRTRELVVFYEPQSAFKRRLHADMKQLGLS